MRSRWLTAVLLLLTLAAPLLAQTPPATSEVSARLDQLIAAGNAAQAQGKYNDMQTLGEQALGLARQLGEPKRTAQSLLLVATSHYQQARYTQALSVLAEAEGILAANTNVSLQMVAESLHGNLDRNIGQMKDALTHFENWLTLNRSRETPASEAPVLRVEGIVYYQIGDFDQATAYYDRALAAARASHDTAMQAGVLLSIGVVSKARQHFPDAVKTLSEARTLAQQAGQQALISEITNSLADTHAQMNELDQANNEFLDALAIARSINARGLASQIIERLGSVAMLRHRPEEALPYYEEAMKTYTETGRVPEKQWSLELAWGSAFYELHRLEEASEKLQASISDVESLEHFSLGDEMSRALPISIHRAVFETATRGPVDRGLTGDALELADRSHARGFLEMLRDAHADPSTDASRAPTPATLRDIQGSLGPADAFVEYLICDEETLAWTVTANTIDVHHLPARAVINAYVEKLRAAMSRSTTPLTARRDAQDLDALTREGYKLLLAPLADDLLHARHIQFVPDGALGYVPFEALRPTPSTYFLERHTVAYSPAASAMLMLERHAASRNAATKSLLVFGGPDYSKWTSTDATRQGITALPNARAEALAIGQLYQPRQRLVRVGADANKARLAADAIGDYKMIHFAVHGIVNETTPQQSGLALGPSAVNNDDGVLRMKEIAALKLRADLVTLSACETASGKLLAGEGLMSLGRAFFYAGARRVVASLWNVNDASTSALMVTFYEGLRAGKPADEALRAAKIAMLKGPNPLWRNPHFWSAFVTLQ